MVSNGYTRTYCEDTETGHIHNARCYEDCTASHLGYPEVEEPPKEEVKNHKYQRWENGDKKKFWM